jgi:flagellar motor switch protein FliM
MSDPEGGPLTQVQIDQLVEAVREGQLPPGKGSLAPVTVAKSIDFRDPSWSQDRIIRRRLGVLDLVFSRLTPALQITMTKNLRFPIRASVARMELQKFGDFAEQLSGKSTLLGVVRLDPLRGFSLICMDRLIIYSLIDALMGGLGVPDIPDDREISEIEASLLERIHADIGRDFENAWRPWFPLSVEHVRTDRLSKYVTALPKQEVCHVAQIEVAGDVLPPSSIWFVLPYANLEPLHDAISAGSGEEVDPNWRSNLERHVRETLTTVTAALGETELRTSRIGSLAEGDVIELPVRADEEIEVRVEGEPTFWGRLGQTHKRYGIRITKSRAPVKRIVDRAAGQILVRKGLISREQLVVAQMDEILNRRPFVDSVVARGWVDKSTIEKALS